MRPLAIFLLCGNCIAALNIIRNSSSGALGLNLLADSQGAEIDIVAVHGLDGLISRLWTEQRPIMFVGHSLGGLVIKTALLNSYMADIDHLEEQKSIELSTYAVMFLGTPHRGSEGARLAKVLTTILSIFSHTNIKPLHQMESDGEWVEELQERYNSISKNFKTVFFYETLAMPIPFGSTIVVPKALEFYSRSATQVVKKNWERWFIKKTTFQAPDRAEDKRLEARVERVPEEFRLGVTFKTVWNQHFTGRNRTLQLIDDILRPGSHRMERKEAVLYGTGGIDARRPDTVKTSITECGNHILGHYRINGLRENPRFQFLEETIQSGHISRALSMWLGHEENDSWLLIIDNLDDPKTIDLKEILPPKAKGSVLITSRRSDLAITRNSIQVPLMEQDEAFTLLTTGIPQGPEIGTDEWRNAQAIIQRLAYLPLAISQAGAHIAMNPSEMPFAAYLDLYHRYPKEILSRKARKAASDEKDDTVLTTWEISFEAVQNQMPEAAEVLLVSGYLAPEGISQELFTYEGFFSGYFNLSRS
ncbi:hypothetical protein CGMCC3_g5809 [Colletotrichum fructicola]|nr:uncharacterized protein CGMCC3_g5809 [Colletotrichum fructicola]KAE9578200.1 hypothetical protein CGMCC3_g5809 [Colletotrichum fructicola]